MMKMKRSESCFWNENLVEKESLSVTQVDSVSQS